MNLFEKIKKIKNKRLWAIVLAAAVIAGSVFIWLEAAPGTRDASETTGQTSSHAATSASTATTTLPEPTATPSPTPEPTPTPGMPLVLEMNLLTGERLEQPIEVQTRPIAVMINNTNKALPQIGIAAADLLFEMEVEGGITRLMAVFAGAASIPEELGSIRSARHNYVDLACGMDALLVHVGGSFIALDKIRDERITTIDMHVYSAPFWRDRDWMENRGYEHSVKTSGTRMTDFLESRNIRSTLENPEPLFSFYHPETFVPADGPAAIYAHVPFSFHTKAEFFYDENSREYSKHQFGRPHLDMALDRPVSFTNVILLQTEVKVINNKGHINADLSVGKGYYLAGGHYQEITWAKGSTYDSLKLYDSEGNTLQLNTGKSYIGIVSAKRAISFSD